MPGKVRNIRKRNIYEQRRNRIVPLRELSYEDTKKEIIEYAENAGKKKVYISEIVEKLRLDIELVKDILCEWRDRKCRESCEEDEYDSYTCPVMSCQYNNYTVTIDKRR